MAGNKRNGTISWVLGALVASGILGILGVAFANQQSMSEHKATERPHAPLAVQLDNIEQDVAWMRQHLEAMQ